MGVIDSRFQLRGGNDILYRLRAVNPARRLVLQRKQADLRPQGN
jgi:hypothetical protein